MRSSRGFTLLELMIAVTLTMLVALSFAGLYGTAQRYLIQETDYAVLQSEVGYAMEHITRRALPATDIAVADGNGDGRADLYIRYDPAPSTADPLDGDIWVVYFLQGTTLRFDPDLGIPPARPATWPAPNNSPGPIEEVARRMTAFSATLDASLLMATIQLTSERGRAPEPAEVVFQVSPRSMFSAGS